MRFALPVLLGLAILLGGPSAVPRPWGGLKSVAAEEPGGVAKPAVAGLSTAGAGPAAVDEGQTIADGVTFLPGPVNSVGIQRGGRRLAVYGWTGKRPAGFDLVLLTHGRRDVIWAARPLTESQARAVAPAREMYGLEKPADFWKTFAGTRFHDYAQQSTKVADVPLPVARWVKDGDLVEWQGLPIRVLETPGFTRGSVTYVAELSGKRVAFTGDLIYGDGQILDLYSFQDAIPEAQIRGYHGYGSRLAELVASLRKLADVNPDLIVPARGPLIQQPRQAIDRLIGRVQAVYRNYLSTNALHWYFKEDRMKLCGRRVLGPDAEVELMPYSRHEATPSWVFEHSTSRLLISDSGHAFLLDCGYQRVIDAVQDLMDKGLVKQVDGLFVTHFHDDHTDMVQAAAEHFQCPVYATPEYADVLEHPEAYHLPAMTANPIRNVHVKKDGEVLKWKEFELTFHFFPGQAYNHGALLVKKANETPIFFIGDSFAPSGFDDYCVLNRNLLHDDDGYLLCLKKLRQAPRDLWLVNEHIQHVFSFSEAEMKYLEGRFRARIDLLRELFPWDDPNYGVDEQWAVFYPYGLTLAAGETREVQLRVTNHSPIARTFRVTPRVQSGLRLMEHQETLTLQPHASGAARVVVQATEAKGQFLILADIASDGIQLRDWVEALVTVE